LQTECDLLIIDEAHRATSEQFRKVFENIKYKQLLCLTATLPANEERAEILTAYAPVVYECTIDDAPEAVSPYLVLNVPVRMDRSTAARYRVFDSMFKTANKELARHIRKTTYRSLFEFAQSEAKKSSQYSSAAKAYWTGMSMRKLALYNAPTKIVAVKNILAAYPSKK
jgi:superfamily II DNA or RNA helicase